MSEATGAVCNCCGLSVPCGQGEDCPRCHYPINIRKEMRFLEGSIDDLRRVAEHGGAKMTVTDLIGRYQNRLDYLRKAQELMTKSAVGPQPTEAEVAAKGLQRTLAASSAGVNVEGAIPASQPEQGAQRPERVFSFRTFLADQTINILASLGAFIGLVGALSFVATTTNLWLSFVVLFLVQAVFGVVGIGAYRFASLRVVAIIYTVIFALLVPLVGFSAYRLAKGHLIALSTPTLLVVALTYAALVYGALAVYQHFKLFGYFSVTALVVAELALAQDFNLALWWWPVVLLLLAFPAALALPRPAGTGSERPFSGPWVILREPVRNFAFVALAVDILGIILVSLLSYSYDSFDMPHEEWRLAILCMNVLLLLWVCLALRLTKRTRWLPALAYLFPASVLALCYALTLRPIGYVLALTSVAVLYHGLNRFVPRIGGRFASLALQLDLLALLFAFIVPFIAVPPLQLLARLYAFPGAVLPPFGLETALECVAVALCCALTLSVALRLTGASRVPGGLRAGWCWILLLSGFLLNWLYTVVVLAAHVDPLWAFFFLTLVLLAAAVLVRSRFSTAWSSPLDVVASVEIAQTLLLSFNKNGDITTMLLLFFAAALYAILLYQRRYRLFVVPTCMGLLALPLLLERPRVLLVAALLLPFVAAIVHRWVAEKRNVPQGKLVKQTLFTWEWPLLAIGLLYGLSISVLDAFAAQSTMQSWLHVPSPVALEVACLALVWYVAAALARMKAWLFVVAGFVGAALLFPANSFWALTVVTLVATVLAVGIRRRVGRVWALPLYGTALLGALMTGYNGAAQHQPLTGYVVLAFAALAFILMLMERTPELVIFAAGLAAWAILRWQPSLSPALLLVACSLLCLLVFVSQFVWNAIRPVPLWLPAPTPARLLSIIGQGIVVFAAVVQGGLSGNAGWLAHAGASALLILTLLLVWYGRLQSLPLVRRACVYGTGLLASLVISWELLALRQSNLDLLALAPATYLIVIAPLLGRDALFSDTLRHRLSQFACLAGSILLLLPILWLSFGSEDANLLYTFILIAEALALLVLGIGVRMRLFVLAGAALIIIGTLHMLFLPVLGLPPSLALTLLGGLLLAIATVLSLVRHRLQAAWMNWR